MKTPQEQRELVDYVKSNHPCYPRKKHSKMKPEELEELERLADEEAIKWLDKSIPWWREVNTQKANKVYVTVSKDEEEDNEY